MIDNSVISEWLSLKQQIEVLAAKEKAIRIKIAAAVLGDKTEGSKTSTIDGVKMTATAVVNYTIDKEEFNLLKDQLSQEELNCIRYKPELILGNFRKLDAEKPALLMRVVSTSQGLPQLKVV